LVLCLLLAAALGFACRSGDGGEKPAVDLNAIATATMPDPLPQPVIVGAVSPVPSGESYTVEDGDSLSSIAAAFGVTAEEIAAANGIDDPRNLSVGQVLIIPGVPSGNSDVLATTEEPEQPAETPTPPEQEQQTYIVQDGDIPETIARQFGITADELMAANGITDPTSLQIGDELIIPAPQPE
jgi:LysM repeat protein